MAPLAVPLILAGGGMMALSAIKQGQIAEAQGKFAEQIAIRNQQALERQAKAERAASRIEETRITRKEKIIKAQQRAIIGKSGVGLAGATLSLLTETAFQFSLERNLMLRRGVTRGRELIERGKIELAKGRWASVMGKQQKIASYFSAAGSILGAAGTAGLLSRPPVLGTTGLRTTGIGGAPLGGGTTYQGAMYA